MTVRRPPNQVTDKKLEEFISQGGSTAAKPAQNGDRTDATVNLRIPVDVLTQVDEAVKQRRLPTPRHRWLLEAIFEKLDREQGKVEP